MALYAITISGNKYYFTGDLSESTVAIIDEFCRTFTDHDSLLDQKSAHSRLYGFICCDLKCKINPLRIEHIFRINL